MERNRACGARVGLREGEVAAHALLGGDLTWLLPDNLSELKAFRDSHALEGIRELFRVRRRTLQRAGADDLQAASEEMVAAVYQAVQEALKELETGRNSDITTIGLRVIEVASSIGLRVLTTVFSFPLALNVPLAALVPTWTAWDLSRAEMEWMCCIYGIPNKQHVLWFCRSGRMAGRFNTLSKSEDYLKIVDATHPLGGTNALQFKVHL